MNAWFYEVRDMSGKLLKRDTGFVTNEEAHRAAQAYANKSPHEKVEITTGPEIVGGSVE